MNNDAESLSYLGMPHELVVKSLDLKHTLAWCDGKTTRLDVRKPELYY